MSTSDEASSKSGFQRSPKFGQDKIDSFSTLGRTTFCAPSWRGWVLGLLSVVALCKIVPVTDYVLMGTRLTLNVLPFTSIFAAFALVVVYNLALSLLKKPLRLSRQDLALVFCMTMVANHIPGHGFLSYYSAEVSGASYYATPENRWGELVQPHIPENLVPRDPVDATSAEPRPVEWFYTGLPRGQSVPYAAWVGSYMRWALAMLCMYGMMFAVCALVEKHWSDAEKLPFPLAQVPSEIMWGVPSGGATRPPARNRFFRDPLAWWGIGVTFTLQSWNALHTYYESWPNILLRNQRFGWDFLSNPPWNQLNPIWIVVYPSIIGLTYLISSEISFSLWFFYIVVLKLLVLSVIGLGLGARHGNFMWNAQGDFGLFINIGTGALIGMVLISFWSARRPLVHSLRQALGLTPPDDEADKGDVSPRTLWSLLALSFAGSVIWLRMANVDILYGTLAVSACLVLSMGVARLISIGGIFYPQVQVAPLDLTALAVPPSVMGSASYVPLSMWSRLAVFDFYRLAPAIPIITAMHVGRITGVRRRSLFGGIAVAVVLAMVLGFFGFFHTVYNTSGGASTSGWVLNRYPRSEYRRIARRTAAIENFHEKEAELEATGQTMPPAEIPTVAQRDYKSIRYLAIGAAAMLIFLTLRTRLFWFPHPIGFAVWAGQRAIALMWFSFLLGWMIKSMIVKFGGLKVYRRWKRFFVGMIVGEALAAIIWIFIAWLNGTKFGYTMHFN